MLKVMEQEEAISFMKERLRSSSSIHNELENRMFGSPLAVADVNDVKAERGCFGKLGEAGEQWYRRQLGARPMRRQRCVPERRRWFSLRGRRTEWDSSVRVYQGSDGSGSKEKDRKPSLLPNHGIYFILFFYIFRFQSLIIIESLVLERFRLCIGLPRNSKLCF